MKHQQFVSFQVPGGLFGFDIRLVKEITPAVHITPVPLKVGDVSGVVNIRGQVVVVLDLRVSLGGSEQQITDDSQIIILKTTSEIEAVSDYTPNFDLDYLGSIPVGFLVGSVGDIVTVEPSRIEDAPSHLLAQYRSYVEGVVRLDPLPLVILNAGAILGATA
jgi:purine-binding chemotaxis protein CheW